MGTNLLVSTGAVSCYPAPMVKNLVCWWQIFEVLQLQPQKNVQSDRVYMSVGIVGLSHVRATRCTRTPSLQDVEFLDRETPDLMSRCCSVLTR